LFLAKVDDVEKFIVSLPVDFSGQEKRVVSFVVGNSEQLNFSSIESENEKEHMGKNLIEKDEDVYSYIGVGPDGQEMFVERIMLTFNDASNLRRSMDYSQYAFLMGKLRELPLRSEAERINRQFLSGQWGMITNNSEIFVYDDITALDILEGRAWLSKISGSEGSTMEIMYEWYKINEDRAPYLIAKGTLNATWVRIIDHGVVKVEPFPSYLQQLMDRMAPKSNNINNNYEKDKNELLLNCKFKNSNMLTDKIILYKEQFKTSYQNSNIVGNIYYANYYLWQSQIKDNYFSINFSKYFDKYNPKYDLFCINSKVNHLREAMPFDVIEVTMSIKAIYENGLILSFDYYRVGDNNKQEKLATGEASLLFVEVDIEKKILFYQKFPLECLDMLLKTTKIINIISANALSFKEKSKGISVGNNK
jgi:enediyne polyketide synthase